MAALPPPYDCITASASAALGASSSRPARRPFPPASRRSGRRGTGTRRASWRRRCRSARGLGPGHRACPSACRATAAPTTGSSRASGAAPSARSMSAAASGDAFAATVIRSAPNPWAFSASMPRSAHARSLKTPIVNNADSNWAMPVSGFSFAEGDSSNCKLDGRRLQGRSRAVAMPDHDADVLIVGAGPAGAWAARQLALGGASVRAD